MCTFYLFHIYSPYFDSSPPFFPIPIPSKLNYHLLYSIIKLWTGKDEFLSVPFHGIHLLSYSVLRRFIFHIGKRYLDQMSNLGLPKKSIVHTKTLYGRSCHVTVIVVNNIFNNSPANIRQRERESGSICWDILSQLHFNSTSELETSYRTRKTP